jgi:hypothetical protein
MNTEIKNTETMNTETMNPNEERIRTVHGVEEPCSSSAADSGDSASQATPTRDPNNEGMSGESSPASCSSLIQAWKTERKEVAACIDDLRHWMDEVSQLGIPHFGETATRLGPLRQRLIHHFALEEEIIERFARPTDATTSGSDDPRHCSSREHRELMGRLDDMLSRLAQTDPPFSSWQAAMKEVEQFVDLLQEHESHESERMQEIR